MEKVKAILNSNFQHLRIGEWEGNRTLKVKCKNCMGEVAVAERTGEKRECFADNPDCKERRNFCLLAETREVLRGINNS